jgi:pimeloyl-ACP methyl ester carboxylesterase
LTRLGCPVIIFAGRYDYTTPTAPVRTWFDKLKAPSKRWIWFENSAHMIYGEEPGRVLLHLVLDARPFAEKFGDVAPEAEGGEM